MFDPIGLPGLSEEAKALAPAELAAQARMAERLLRVESGLYDGLDAAGRTAWADMILLQMAFQLEHSTGLKHQGIGDLQQTFRDLGPVSPEARIIRDQWFASGSDDAVSDGSWSIDGVYDDEV